MKIYFKINKFDFRRTTNMEKYGIMLSVEKSKNVMLKEDYERFTTEKVKEFVGTFVLNDMSDRMRVKMLEEVRPWLSENKLEKEMLSTYVMALFKREECPICYRHYGEQDDGYTFLTKDGKDNSDYAEVCKHYVCHACCWELSKQKYVKCPLCREDWTDWIHTHYTESDDEDE